MSPRRTTKEPKLPPSSPLAPIVDQLQAMIRGANAAPITDTSNEALDFTQGRIEGLQTAVTLIQRAGAVHVTNDDGQRLIKLERDLLDKRIPPDVVALLDKRIDDLTARVRALEDLSPSTKARAMPAILKEPERKPGRCARTLLRCLAERKHMTTTLAQLAALSGYSAKSSSFTHAVGELRRLGLVDGVAITEVGQRAAGSVKLAPRGGLELLEYWLPNLKKAERAILRAIVESGPIDMPRLADFAGYSSTSSSFTHAIGTLRNLKLVQPGWPARAATEFGGAK